MRITLNNRNIFGFMRMFGFPNGQNNRNGNLDCGRTLGAASIHLSGEGDVKSFLDIPHLRYVLEVEQPTKTLIIVHLPQNVYINIS